jgi:type I restriction enzyme S subunit
LNNFTTKITDGEHGTVERLESGKKYLMARNIGHNGLVLNNVSYISEINHNKIFKRCNPQKGDLLLVCVGATIGRCCLMPEVEDFSLARSVALIKPNEQINSQFLLYQFKQKHFQH